MFFCVCLKTLKHKLLENVDFCLINCIYYDMFLDLFNNNISVRLKCENIIYNYSKIIFPFAKNTRLPRKKWFTSLNPIFYVVILLPYIISKYHFQKKIYFKLPPNLIRIFHWTVFNECIKIIMKNYCFLWILNKMWNPFKI